MGSRGQVLVVEEVASPATIAEDLVVVEVPGDRVFRPEALAALHEAVDEAEAQMALTRAFQ